MGAKPQGAAMEETCQAAGQGCPALHSGEREAGQAAVILFLERKSIKRNFDAPFCFCWSKISAR